MTIALKDITFMMKNIKWKNSTRCLKKIGWMHKKNPQILPINMHNMGK